MNIFLINWNEVAKYNYTQEEFYEISRTLREEAKKGAISLQNREYFKDGGFANFEKTVVKQIHTLAYNMCVYQVHGHIFDTKYLFFKFFLSDELYTFLKECAILKGVCQSTSKTHYEYLDGVCNLVQDRTREALRLINSSERYDECDFPEEQIRKFFHLSYFIGNQIGSLISYENNYNEKNNGLNTSRRVYNLMDGFDRNSKYLLSDIYYHLSVQAPLEDEQINYALHRTQVKKHKLLETSFYLKHTMMDLLLFDGMEYTPIIVNLCKAVETLEADLISKLNDKYDFNSTNFEKLTNFRGEKISFDKAETWKDQVTIGSLQKFINDFNTKDGKYTHALYNDVITLEFKIDNKSNTYKKRSDKAQMLEEYARYWNNKVRNGNLHKHDILNREKVENIFEDTMCLIALLIQWFNIVCPLQ